MKPNKVVDIIMKRDGLELKDAMFQFLDTRTEIIEAIESGADFDEIEDILSGNLGLEMDYIDAFIF